MSRGERCAVCGVAQRACRATPTGQVHFRDFVVRALCEASSLVSRTRRCRSPRGAEIRRRAAHFAQNSTQESVELGISAPVKSFYRGFCAVNESRRRRRFTGGTKRSRNAPRADLMIGAWIHLLRGWLLACVYSCFFATRATLARAMGCGSSAPSQVAVHPQSPDKGNLPSRDARGKRELSGSTDRSSLSSFDGGSRRPSLEEAEDVIYEKAWMAYVEPSRRTSFSNAPLELHQAPIPAPCNHEEAMLYASVTFEKPDLSKALAPGSGFEEDNFGVTRHSRRRGASYDEDAMMEAAAAGEFCSVALLLSHCLPPLIGILRPSHNPGRSCRLRSGRGSSCYFGPSATGAGGGRGRRRRCGRGASAGGRGSSCW